MGMFGDIGKSVSQVVGNAGSLQKAQLGQINKVIGKVLTDGGAAKSLGGLDASIGKAIKESMSGRSSQQTESLAAIVKSQIASAGKAADGSAKLGGNSADMQKLQQLLKQQQQLQNQIEEMMKVVHKSNMSVINSIK